jgi:hypothetical protein
LVNEILDQYSEATVRQIYYRMVSPPYQYLRNTRSMYNSFDSMLTKAREDGDIDWRKIVDHTRSVITPEEFYYDSPDDYLKFKKEGISWWGSRYDIDFWENQPNTVRVFIEKDALAQVVADVALQYKVSVISGHGYGSLTQLMSQAEQLKKIGKPIILLYFGDFDPSGLDIDRSACERLSDYSGGVDFQFIRVALVESDIVGLPPNPTKSADTRAAKYVARYGDRCWELDALPPDQLKSRVREAIARYIDPDRWAKDEARLREEREYINQAVEDFLER